MLGNVVMAASECFERALSCISNALEGFDGVDNLSDEQTSGVFNFIQRKDASAFGQHQKFPPHARKISDTQ